MNPHPVKIEFTGGKASSFFTGPVAMVTFGSEQYQWHPDGKGGHAAPDGPAARSTVKGGLDSVYTIPKASITVLRGQIAGAR